MLDLGTFLQSRSVCTLCLYFCCLFCLPDTQNVAIMAEASVAISNHESILVMLVMYGSMTGEKDLMQHIRPCHSWTANFCLRMREVVLIFYLTSVILGFCYTWLSPFLINILECVEEETLRIKQRDQRLLTQNTGIFSSTRSQEGTEETCPFQARKK